MAKTIDNFGENAPIEIVSANISWPHAPANVKANQNLLFRQVLHLVAACFSCTGT